MTNDMEVAEELLDEHDYNLLNILGIAGTVKGGRIYIQHLVALDSGTWQQSN